MDNIKKYYLFHILAAQIFFFPVIVLFWQKNGLSLTQIMLLQSLFSISIVLLEVPSGYFADAFGRKLSLITASTLIFLGAILYSIGHNFYEFLVAELLWGAGISFVSGADTALVYDTLKEMGKEKEYKKVIGNGHFYYLLSGALSNIIGGFLGEISYRLTIYASIPFMALLVPISLSFREPKILSNKVIEEGHIKRLLKSLKKYFFHNSKIRSIIIFSSVVLGINMVVLWFYQPYFKLIGVKVYYFGFIYSSFSLIAAIASKYAHKIEELIGTKRSLFLIALAPSLSFILMGKYLTSFSFLFIYIQKFITGVSGPIISDYINKLVSSKVRATILSVQNLIERLFYAAIIPFIGKIADIYSLPLALIILGTAGIFIGLIMIGLLYKNEVIKSNTK